MAATATPLPAARLAHPILAYWNLLSLDAPTVAVVWCFAFARAAGVPVSWKIALALAATTWMLYALDRIADVQRSRSQHQADGLRERHWFHARHTTAIQSLCVISSVGVAWIALTCVPAATLQWLCLVAAAAAVYFAGVHWKGARRISIRAAFPAKEAGAASIFAAAVAIPSLSLLTNPGRFAFPAIALACLFGLNCVLIETGEAERTHRTHAAMQRIVVAGAALAFVCIVVAVTSSTTGTRTLSICIALSAALLLAVAIKRNSLADLTFRIACDAALLTPLPWLLLTWRA